MFVLVGSITYNSPGLIKYINSSEINLDTIILLKETKAEVANIEMSMKHLSSKYNIYFSLLEQYSSWVTLMQYNNNHS